MLESGVYRIVNKNTNVEYIGSAVNLRRRKNEHFNDLLKNKHCNSYLQNSYNKHGLEAFSFEVLFYCDIEYLRDLESQVIRAKGLENLYNISEATVGGCQLGEVNGMHKLTSAEVLEIVDLLNTSKLTFKEIGQLYHVADTTIHKIHKGRRWKHLTEGKIKVKDRNYGDFKAKRISDEDVRTIRKEYAKGVTQKELAERYKTSSGYISDIVNNKTRTRLT